VNVSVNNLCEATVFPGMILTPDSDVACTYGIELFDENDNVINLGTGRADISSAYVGRYLKVRIFEAGVTNPNSCWSIVNVEDKLPPDIICIGNDTIPCYDDIFSDEARAVRYLERQLEGNIVDNCNNADLTVAITKNELTRMLCQTDFAAMRVIGYNAVDNFDNVTSCEDTIFYERFELDSLDAPKNYDDDMAINCDEPYPTIQYLLDIDRESPGMNSMPNIDGISIADYADSLFTERGVCNFKMTTSDLVFPTCGNTYKVVRRWTVIDWCNSTNLKVFNQVIKVTDTELRADRISNLGVFDADKGICTKQVELPFPSVAADECNDWTYTLFIQEPNTDVFIQIGGVRDSVPTIVTQTFGLGVSTIRYVLTDACDNEDIVEFDVTIEDNEAPVPVCDSRTVVTLNDSFLGKVFARSFDDGSYDACSSIVSYQVRRVDRAETTCETPQDFDDFVKFCCADIGNTVMVELQVTDEYGITASCMTETVVQFKGQGPSVTCPPNIGTQPCTSYETFDISTLAPPSISSANPCLADALTPSIREGSRSIDICGDGYIDIEWYYNITGDDEVICAQRIVFANTEIFTDSNITWPEDRTVESCDEAPPTAQELEDIITPLNNCSNVVASEPTDREVENVPGVCKRIIRTWTVVDWCRFPADPNARWVYDQIVDVINSSGPSIDVSGSNITLDPKPDSCRAHIIVEGIATDDCTAAPSLAWTHKLDLISPDGQELPLLFERPGRILERRIDAGNYVLTWSVTDDCGNTSTARQLFTVEDEDPPSAICGFSINELDASGSVTIMAAELNDGSTDNCNDQLSFAIKREGTSASPTSSLTFTCRDIGVNTVELWVTDLFGNQDVCIASVDIRDAAGNCQMGSSALSVTGNIMTVDEIAVESAEVMLNTSSITVASEMTEIDGEYAFDDLSSGNAYELEVHKDDDPLNGVSTLDLVLIQRHILGLQALDSPYKLIAADVNVNGSVSAVDLVVLRRLILGLIEQLPDTESWKFISEDHTFSNPSSPWPLEEGAILGQLSIDEVHDLLAIKMGDVNGNAVANSGFASPRSTSVYNISTRTQLDNGQLTYEVIAEEDIESYGYQLSIDYDKKALTRKSVKSNQMLIVDDMIADKDGSLAVSLAGSTAYSYQKGDVILQVTFALSASTENLEGVVQLSNNGAVSNEIYDGDLNVLKIGAASEQLSNQVVLHQNRPNPFEHETLIDFEIPKEDQVTFELFDMNGMRVFSRTERYSAGTHQLKVSSHEIGLNKGIYYYQIHTQQRSLIRKMIIL